MAQQQQPDLKFKRGNAVIRDKIKAFAFALGCLLGDAGIKKNENRMCIEQADLGYVEWKKKMCVDLGLASKDSSIGEVERTRTDPVTNKVTKSKSHRFYTKSLFGDWHKPFYVVKSQGDPTFDSTKPPKQRKRFPVELVDWFTHPLALAIFYMDDGGVADNQPYFATGEVPLDEVKTMQKVFKNNFGLDTTIRTYKGVAVGILVRRQSCRKFKELVGPYVSQVLSMSYKMKIT